MVKGQPKIKGQFMPTAPTYFWASKSIQSSAARTNLLRCSTSSLVFSGLVSHLF